MEGAIFGFIIVTIKSSISRGKILVQGLITVLSKVNHLKGNFATGESLKNMGMLIFSSIHHFFFCRAHPSTMTTFIASKTKRANVMGAPEQVFKTNDVDHFLINDIENGVITAIKTINMGSHCLQYLFSLVIYKDLNGKPKPNVDNASNESGEFSLLKVDLISICRFISIDKHDDINPSLSLGEMLPSEVLSNTG